MRRPGTASGSRIGRFWRLRTQRAGPSCCSSANTQASAVSLASAGPDDVDVRRGAQVRQLLHRLVRRPVLAEPDRVVRVDVDHRQVHQRRQAHGALHVVEEVEERGAERPHAVQVRGRSRSRPCRARGRRSGRCARSSRRASTRAAASISVSVEGSRSAEPLTSVGTRRGGPLDHLVRGLAGGHRLVVRAEAQPVGVPAVRQPPVHEELELLGQLGAASRGRPPGARSTRPPPRWPRSTAVAKCSRTSSGTRKWASGSQP